MGGKKNGYRRKEKKESMREGLEVAEQRMSSNLKKKMSCPCGFSLPMYTKPMDPTSLKVT